MVVKKHYLHHDFLAYCVVPKERRFNFNQWIIHINNHHLNKFIAA